MSTKFALSLLLTLGATIGILFGCGAAPASQTAESISVPPAPKVVPASELVAVPTQAAEMAQADSAPQKAIEAVESEPESSPVEVGYKVGMHVPEFGMSLLDGSRVTSAAIFDEGKPVFIYFHTTW
jgi:hypothetical protein